MNEQIILDGTGYHYGDVALAVLITFSAVLTYFRIGFQAGALRLPIPRMAMAVGFTVWGMRFWYTIASGGDVLVAPLSMGAIGLVTGGYCVVQMFAIRRSILLERHPLLCFVDPNEPCERADRVAVLIKGTE